MEDIKKIEDDDLEMVNGGMTVDYTLNHYCPYHLCEHPGIQKMQERLICNGADYPTYYCPDAHSYFFEANNGFFDGYGGLLVRKA